MKRMQRLRREGAAIGEQRGETAGRGAVSLRRRFCAVSQATASRVQQTGIDEPDDRAERIPTAATLQDVSGGR